MWRDQVVALVALVALGVGFGLVEVGLLTLTQRLVPADVLGRVYGVQETLAALALAGAVRRLGGGGRAPEAVFERLRAVPAFQTLPMATVETLAERARSEEYALGSDIVREGEEGDSFFVISAGAVKVTEGGALRRVQRPGDFFGEIALLHRVPRTATVSALEETHVLAVDRADFLAAVGVHPRTRHVLHDVAVERLGRDSGPG